MKHGKAAGMIQSGDLSRQRHRRYMIWSLVLLFSLTLFLPLIPYAIATIQDGSVPNPGIDFWNEVRQRDKQSSGTTQVAGVDTSILINNSGETWRLFRMEKLIPWGAMFMAANRMRAVSRRLGGG